MTQFCNHESELRITLSPWAIEYEFVCRKCGRKKIKGSSIVPMAYTGHGIRPSFKHYRPPEPPKDDDKKKKHWWHTLIE
jgi:hypothetical protein